MNLTEIQNFCKDILSKVNYPRLGTVIGLQQEIGRLSEVIMDKEIYKKSISKTRLERCLSELFFSLLDLCNTYEVDLSAVSNKRIAQLKKEVSLWEAKNSGVLSKVREKID